MLLAWMAYSVLFGALAYGAALAAERLALVCGRSSRFIWLGAAIVASVGPVLLATRPRVSATAPSESGTGGSLAVSDGIVTFPRASREPTREPLVARTRRILAKSDDAVIAAWALASLSCLALIGRAAAGIRRRRARWHIVAVDGTAVLVAPDVGPAVVGAFSPRIVIPRWALSLDADARALMLCHEAEHIRARDPLVLLAATTATALLPWNGALWLVARRLRLAIEIDCDRRVLRSAARAREYGELLLAVGARLSEPLPLATSLAERRPFLERRIKAMTALSPRHPRLVAAGCTALVAIASIAAVRAPRPASLVERHATPARLEAPPRPTTATDSRLAATSKTVPPAMVTPSRASAPRTIGFADSPRVATLAPVGPIHSPDSLTVAEIRALIQAHHPTVLDGDPNINTITLVVDARGNYVVSTAESRPVYYEVPDGRGARGRSGGAEPSIAPGGGAGFARGRVGGGLREVPVPQDSEALRARLVAMAAERLAKIQQAVRDTAYGRQLKEEKLTQFLGDSLVLQEKKTFVLGDGFVRRNGQPGTADQMREVGAKIGLNMDVLSRLIDPQSIDAVQINTFAPGQLGTTALRVYVVHQRL